MWLVPFLLFACAPPDTAALPDIAAPPPVQLIGDGLVPGQPARFRVRGAPVGATIALYATRGGTGPGGCFAPNLCLDLLDPVRLVATSTIDRGGVATLRLITPTGFTPGTIVHLQAYASNAQGAALSPVLTRVVDDGDFDGFLGSADNCPGLSNPTQGDVDGDLTGDVCDCAPFDPDFGAAAWDYAADGIDQDCSGTPDDGPSPFDGTWTLTWDISETAPGPYTQRTQGELTLVIDGTVADGEGTARVVNGPPIPFAVSATAALDLHTSTLTGELIYPAGTFGWTGTLTPTQLTGVPDPVNSLGHDTTGTIVGERPAP